MVGVCVGVASAVGALVLARVLRHRRRCGPCGHAGGHGGGHCGHHGRGRWMRERMLWRAFRKLGTSPEQERVIKDALNEFEVSTREAKGAVAGLREQVAAAFTQEAGPFASVLSGVEPSAQAGVDRIRAALARAVQTVHDTLDARQRQIVAGWLAGGWARRC